MSNRASWDRVRIETLNALSDRTVCLRHKVACILVTPGNVVASEGYNGPPPRSPHCDEIGCAKANGDDCRGCHAEINAIINCHGAPRTLLENGTAYVSLFPCNQCAKSLVQAGIKRVVYLEEYLREVVINGVTTKTPELGAMGCFKENGVKVERWNQSTKKTDIIYNPSDPENQSIPPHFEIYIEKWDSPNDLMDKYSKMGFRFNSKPISEKTHYNISSLNELGNLRREVSVMGTDKFLFKSTFTDSAILKMSPADLLQLITKTINQALADAK